MTNPNPSPSKPDEAIALVNRISTSQYVQHRQELISAFNAVRQQTLVLSSALSAEDMQIQSMPDASPTKWHLAHTSWFFEAFILANYLLGFCWHSPMYHKLFNSYYNALGEPFDRHRRGMISRPSLKEVLDYRDDINKKIEGLLLKCADSQLEEIAPLLVLGINHEQQHQELILTDIKHTMFQNPAFPAVFEHAAAAEDKPKQQWLEISGGEVQIGFAEDGFCFDNELPRHRALLNDYVISNRLITNAEWLAFMQDGGYQKPLLWLSDGWAWRNTKQVKAPYYWLDKKSGWHSFGLTGMTPLVLDAPVAHISFYEAEAYACWSDCRLPTEQEWEHAVDQLPVGHNSRSFGSLWEWTASPYSPYPGFNPSKDIVGEYNGKFMINQMVLRGASGATPSGHSRNSYRNFFSPSARWQFSGIRLVKQ